MAFLLNLLDQLEEFTIERNKAIHDAECVSDFICLPRREDNAHGRLCGALHHILALFVEAGSDGIMLFECNKQRRQRWIVVVAEFEVFPRLLEWNP
jgi:hypothetical protein